MAKIERVEALIHPDFLLMNRLGLADPFIHDPKEEALRARWDHLAISVAKNPNSRLVYMTWLRQEEIGIGEKKGLSNPWKDLDLDRIEEYKWMIGQRMVIVPLDARLTSETRQIILNGDTISSDTRLYKQGEWFGACVEAEGNKLGELLDIAPDNRIPVPENSRSAKESKELLAWRQSLNRGV